MPQSSPPSNRELRDFLADLADRGFSVGVAEWVRIERLAATRPAVLSDERWKFALAPIVARSPAEQQRFYDAWDLSFKRHLAPADRVDIAVQSGLVSAAPEPRPRRRFALWLVAALIPLALWVLVAVTPTVIVVIREGQTPRLESRIGEQNSARPLTSPTVERTSIVRPCTGLECVTNARGLLLAVPGLVWLALAVVFRGSVRRVRLRLREGSRTPPFRWSVPATPPVARLDEWVSAAANALRVSQPGDAYAPDIARSIDETVRAAGCPRLHLEPERWRPDYLFLIEQRASNDHFAAWATWAVRRLGREGLSARGYTYQQDPRLCRADGGSQAVPLTRLLQQFWGARLVVIGDAATVLNPATGDPSGWTRLASQAWSDRALLTPVGEADYGGSERRAHQWIPARPFSLQSVAALARLFDAPDEARREAPPRRMRSAPLPPGELLAQPGPDDEHLLAAFFLPDVFTWLCACAVHTELEWDWTMALAEVVAPGQLLQTEERLLSLCRLPWFREGRIPDAWRPRLVDALDPEVRRRVREALIRRIETARAPRGTYAFDKQALDLAAHGYWLAPTPEHRARLERAIDSVADSDVASDALLARERRAWTAAQRTEAPQAQGRLVWARFRERSGWAKVAIVVLALASIAAWLTTWDVEVQTTRTVETAVPTSAAPRVTTPPPPTAPPVTPPGSAGPTPREPASASRPVPGDPAQTERARASAQTTPPASTADTPLTSAYPLSPAPADPTRAAPGPVTSPGADAPAAEARQIIAIGRGAQLSIVMRTLAGYPLPNPTDIDLRTATGATVLLRQRRLRFDRYPSGTVVIDGLRDGIYVLRLVPEDLPIQSRVVGIVGGQSQQVEFMVSTYIEASQVRKVVFPTYDQLPAGLRAALEWTAAPAVAGQSVRPDYNQMTDLTKATLLNIYAQASAISLPNGASVWASIIRITANAEAAVWASARPELRDLLAASPVFAAAASPPVQNPGSAPLQSFKTIDPEPRLGVTFYPRDAEMMIHLRVEGPAAAARKTLLDPLDWADSVWRRLESEPYEVQQLLIHRQHIDPGYRLITYDGSSGK